MCAPAGIFSLADLSHEWLFSWIIVSIVYSNVQHVAVLSWIRMLYCADIRFNTVSASTNRLAFSMAQFTVAVADYFPNGLNVNPLTGDLAVWKTKIQRRITNCANNGCDQVPADFWTVEFEECQNDAGASSCSYSGADKCTSTFCEALAAKTSNSRR